MALDPGTTAADTGMSAVIYQALDAQFSQPLRDAIAKAKDAKEKQAAQKTLDDTQMNWKKLSYCIAKGVVEHIKASMEISGLKASGTVTSGNKVSTQQSEPTTGLVK